MIILSDGSVGTPIACFETPDVVENRTVGWEDETTRVTAVIEDVPAASWYLTRNRIWPLVRSPRYGPLVLGILLACIIIATVLLSPSAESHFIYTDF